MLKLFVTKINIEIIYYKTYIRHHLYMYIYYNVHEQNTVQQ